MEKVTGHTDDVMILRGQSLPHTDRRTHPSHPHVSPHFQCVLDREAHLDSLTVRVERRELFESSAASPCRLRLQRLPALNWRD